MQEAARRNRNAQRLTELFPTFRARLSAVIGDLEAAGFRPRIQDAWRSPQSQLEAFTSGHSKLKFGFHNVTGPGGAPESLAVDMLDDDSPLASRTSYLLRLAAAAQTRGLVTGIRWGLPAKLSAAIDAALAAQDWEAPVKVGWDPTHVQPAGITVTDARNGARPA